MQPCTGPNPSIMQHDSPSSGPAASPNRFLLQRFCIFTCNKLGSKSAKILSLVLIGLGVAALFTGVGGAAALPLMLAGGSLFACSAGISIINHFVCDAGMSIISPLAEGSPLKQFRDDYIGGFARHISPSQRTLIHRTTADAMDGYLRTLKIYPRGRGGSEILFHRELVNIAMVSTHCQTTNQKIVGCKSSFAKENVYATAPGNQVSLEMRVPFIRNDGVQVSPVLLSVCAPALDSMRQPEWSQYVNEEGMLNSSQYSHALDTISTHILQCSVEHPESRVVLCAFGMANFLRALATPQQEIARSIGAKFMAQLVINLKRNGAEVAYSNVGSDFYWHNVNELLHVSEKIGRVDTLDASIPGNWISNNDIIVNAWDPHSVVGNGCNRDRSFDGYVGSSSLAHYVHAFACNRHNTP